jgi:hypothetical protein
MSNNLNDEQLRDLVAKVNARDTDRIKGLLDRFSRDEGFLVLQSIDEYRVRLGFGDDVAKYGQEMDPESVDLFQNGAQAFIQVLSEHPTFQEERSLAAGAPIIGDTDDPFLSELGRDVSELLVAGAVAIGFLGVQDPRYLGALTHVAFNADAVSTLLRTVLSHKPIPRFDDLFHIPDKLQNLYQHTCVLGVQHALNEFGRAAASNKATSRSTGITLLQPNYGCAGDQVTIQGSGFGQQQPNDVEVWFPTRDGRCTKAQVVTQWSDTQIIVVVPANVGNGCVGFVGLPSNPTPLIGAASSLAGEMEQCFGRAAFAAAQKIRRVGNIGLVVSCPPCLPNGANYFRGGPPEIEVFSINGSTDLTVQPNVVLNLTWRVRNAATVRIRRTSTVGPYFDVTNPPSQTINVGKFTGDSPVNATYELTATNGCGTITRTITVRLRSDPVLSIMGIEVVQAIQRPDNSVRLVANKRTIVRVYVDSGITSGFNNGSGPNQQANVTGSVYIPGGYGLLLNPKEAITALPATQIQRDNMDHSLNFEVPWNYLSGSINIQVRVWVRKDPDNKDHKDDYLTGWFDNYNTAVDFHPQRTQGVVMIRIRDDNPARMLPAPTVAQFYTTLAGARTRLPIAEKGFLVYTAPGFEEISTNDCSSLFWGACDLAIEPEWDRMLDEVDWIAGQFKNQGEIWAGLLPSSSDYPGFGGMATGGTGSRSLLSRREYPATFTQELCHTFAPVRADGQRRQLEHSNCGLPANVPGSAPDPDLPSDGKIEDIGIDVTRGQLGLIKAGTADVMSYCGSENWSGTFPPQWTSIKLWNLMFDELA